MDILSTYCLRLLPIESPCLLWPRHSAELSGDLLRRFQIDDELKLPRLLEGELGRL
jgi:hypothetical protein